MAEVTDQQQIIAAQVMHDDLRTLPFLRTRRGWRVPARSTWGNYQELPTIVRESDLALIGMRASYIVDEVLGTIKDDEQGRAEYVLSELGADAVYCPSVVQLLELPDDQFGRRGIDWWLRMLDVMKRYADRETLASLATTRCLPVAAGRVRPSPAIALEGYLVAYSRSDILDDLQSFFGESEVFLIDLGRRPRSRSSASAETAAQSGVREMLAAEPFNVAPEAGPYHVVTHLVLPRMRALASLPELSRERVEQLWRLLEYVRQKWPSYVSEYRRRKNDRATEEEAREKIADQLHVVATTAVGKEPRAVPVRSAYLPTAILDMPGMDIVVAGDRTVRFVHAMHAKPLRVVERRRRGGRRTRASRGPVEFLTFLGAPAGPRVEAVNPTYWNQPIEQRPADLGWVDWSGLPAGAHNRVRLNGDWRSADLERLEARWDRIGERSRRERAAALFRLVQHDWDRLKGTTTATAQFFFYSWQDHAASVSSTWVGRLGTLKWVLSALGTLKRPQELVLDTPQNRSAVAGDRDLLLRWKPDVEAAAIGVGVGRRPAVNHLLETLGRLRGGELSASREEASIVCRAVYAALAETLRELEEGPRAALVSQLAPRFQGNGRRGLIYAPLSQQGSGTEWWPTSRVIQADETSVVGPFLGQIGGRYRQAAKLWDALGAHRSLSPDLVTQLVERDLPEHADQSEAHEYYGRLTVFLEERDDLEGHAPPSKALSTNGWVAAGECLWTSRPEVRAALPVLPWWTPGGRDPSTLRSAAAWLGIREVAGGAASGLRERWTIESPEAIELDLEERWLSAIDLWPAVLVAAAILEPAAGSVLATRTGALRPRTAARVLGTLQFADVDPPLRASIEPPVLLRIRDDLVIATSTDDLFSAQAAYVLVTLVPERRLQAANALASLLSAALHAPDDLDRQRLEYAATLAQFSGYIYHLPADEEEMELEGEIVPVATRRRARQSAAADDGEREARLLADPRAYRLEGIVDRDIDGVAPAGDLIPTSLHPPVRGEEEAGSRSGDSEQEEEGGEEGDRTSRPPSRRYSNVEIEDAARPFVERFEIQRGCTITRQPPRVGADYRATDGRYIEVKAFGDEAPGSFDLEPYEWRAAKNPQIAADYWVYIVDHLLDGKAPRVTAIRNPVLDDNVTTQSTGKLRVRGWRSASHQREGVFAPVVPSGAEHDRELR